jgi:hypothetical protein
MSAMGTTSANAFFFLDPHCVPAKWGCSGAYAAQEPARARKTHGTRDTSPRYMNYNDPRYSDAMQNAGGGGGGGGGGGR